MPNTRHSFQLIELIPSMIKADSVDFYELVCIVQLLRLQLAVIFPVAQKLFEHQA
jgi:hypothetical protein